MGVAFDYAESRPDNIDQILTGLDRYNPGTTEVFQEYIVQQCENQTYDCYANLALLKLYVSTSSFPTVSFWRILCLHLLPANVLITSPPSTSFAGSVQKLTVLNNLLSSADYTTFWKTLRSDRQFAELTGEVSGFEELMRVRIAATVSQAVREVERNILEEWLDLKSGDFDKFVGDVCGWKVDGATVVVPPNKENEAKGTIVRENVKFDQFSRVVRRAYEQAA
ncbi:hypothetical protein FH972_022719 [Carpinus fangiana]|uniref:Eukaryotic translation initiation factor 3 subunit K n=1 Tax=Carpinus fangiana TaxID=176857 RepID=A0A5N6KTQ6_9ROSI|nr:hypothetical protein FH972_022719 [Carpinus fangiana]